MQFPNFDPHKGIHEVVGSMSCPVCDFKDNKRTSADLLNNGHLMCPQCGRISVGDHLRSEKTFKPTSLIRTLVKSAGAILEHLGAGDVSDSWQFIYLWSSRSFLIDRKIDGHYVRLEFNVTYESDCQVAERTTTSDKQFAGFVWDHRKFEQDKGRALPPGIAALFEKLAADQYGLWSIYQSWGNTHWVRGDWHWHSKTHAGLRAIRLTVSWR